MSSKLLQRVFATNGLLAMRFRQHEERPGQLEMAETVLAAFEGNGHTAIQAGTGLGKTFAYLIPALLHAVENKKRIVISTGTLNLQSQIVQKDIPTLQRILADEMEFNAALVKGRNNYICMRKLTAFAQATLQQPLFREPNDSAQWPDIAELFFDKKFIRGDRDEIPFKVSESLWADLGAESDLCMKSKCPFFSECFFYQARQAQRGAQLLVTNHALFFADLAVRREMNEMESDGDAVLVSYDGVIFDEAQSVEDFATDHFTAKVSHDRLYYLARTAVSALKPGGLLQWHDEMDFMRVDAMFNVLLQRAEAFFYKLGQTWSGERTVRFREPYAFEEDLSDGLKEVAAELLQMSTVAQTDEQKQVIAGLAQRAQQMAQDLIKVREMPEGDDYAYWLETGDRQLRQIRLAASPVSIAEMMREELFDNVPVVLTSATLASELVQRLGLEKPKWLRLDSPFDYQKHARLYLPQDAPEASPQNEVVFTDFVARRVPELTALSQGRAFILFTSYRAMQTCYNLCAEELRQQGWLVLMQGEKRREQLLADFVAHGQAVLFAVNSFWEGVDVQGEALSLVVLVKLPFAVPTEPVQQARMEALQREGKDPFRSYTLPQAALRLKQGFGRLIRSRQDTGVIAILDKRILTKYYGKRFLNDLPPAPKIHQLEEVAEFFDLSRRAAEALQRGEAFSWPQPRLEIPTTTRSTRAAENISSSNTASSMSRTTSLGAMLSDDSGFWLPDEDYPATTTRRRSGNARSNDVLFDDIVEDDLSQVPRPRQAQSGRQETVRVTRSSGRVLQSMSVDDVVFDDLAGWEEPASRPVKKRS